LTDDEGTFLSLLVRVEPATAYQVSKIYADSTVRTGDDGDGLNAIISLVFSERPCHPVVKNFRSWPEILHYYSVTGPVHGYALVKVRDAEALAELVERFSGLTGVASASSSVMLRSD